MRRKKGQHVFQKDARLRRHGGVALCPRSVPTWLPNRPALAIAVASCMCAGLRLSTRKSVARAHGQTLRRENGRYVYNPFKRYFALIESGRQRMLFSEAMPCILPGTMPSRRKL
jgi:hypothetical protein